MAPASSSASASRLPGEGGRSPSPLGLRKGNILPLHPWLTATSEMTAGADIFRASIIFTLEMSRQIPGSNGCCGQGCPGRSGRSTRGRRADLGTHSSLYSHEPLRPCVCVGTRFAWEMFQHESTLSSLCLYQSRLGLRVRAQYLIGNSSPVILPTTPSLGVWRSVLLRPGGGSGGGSCLSPRSCSSEGAPRLRWLLVPPTPSRGSA